VDRPPVHTRVTEKDINQTLAELIGMVVKLLVIGMMAIIPWVVSSYPLTRWSPWPVPVLLARRWQFKVPYRISVRASISFSAARLSSATPSRRARPAAWWKITFSATIQVGEDGEKIIAPNKKIVARVIVNSHEQRAVQTK
jgi:hypothetical protein